MLAAALAGFVALDVPTSCLRGSPAGSGVTAWVGDALNVASTTGAAPRAGVGVPERSALWALLALRSSAVARGYMRTELILVIRVPKNGVSLSVMPQRVKRNLCAHATFGLAIFLVGLRYA
jgi:hypothetical protein